MNLSQPPSALTAQDSDASLRKVLSQFPTLVLAMVFGSVASGRARSDSDLDIAVTAGRPLSVDEKIAMITSLSDSTGRPVDLVDLSTVSEPLLGQVIRHGRRLLGSDSAYGRLLSRHLFEQADFMPYRKRILAERRLKWIGK